MAILGAVNYRQISDINLSQTKALATAAATSQTTAFDTGDNSDGNFPEGVDLLLTVPATPTLAAGAIITFTVLADTANPPTTVLSPSLTATVTGTAGTGGAATTFRWRVPANAARYLAVQNTVGSTGGNNSAVSYTAQLLF